MERGATISDDGEVTVYLDPLIVVGDAEHEDVAAEALSAVFFGSAAQLDDRIDGDAGAVNVCSSESAQQDEQLLHHRKANGTQSLPSSTEIQSQAPIPVGADAGIEVQVLVSTVDVLVDRVV
ncbi:hypothetical protein LTR28_006587 [Elasticomyces elasticus]|nr:hypothetical protein LTR28_006587 [Elasticomyces elasticus]